MTGKQSFENRLEIGQTSFGRNRFAVHVGKVRGIRKHKHTAWFQDFPPVIKEVVEDLVVVQKVFDVLEWPHDGAVLIPNDILGLGWEILPSLSRILRIHVICNERCRRIKVGWRIGKQLSGIGVVFAMTGNQNRRLHLYSPATTFHVTGLLLQTATIASLAGFLAGQRNIAWAGRESAIIEK
jgi:hypothetical protein